ncbi:MAG: hypothetical protein FWE09_09165, partial [Treponema sp.]|nr:hypothetical protein [Treponema sp.]
MKFLSRLLIGFLPLAILAGCPGPQTPGNNTVPTVTDVIVEGPDGADVGSVTSAYKATVAGRNGPSQEVTWSVETPPSEVDGAIEPHDETCIIIIDENYLSVHADQAPGVIRVVATSVADGAKVGYKDVKILGKPAAASITVERFDGASLEVNAGVTVIFKATASGENLDSAQRTFDWSVDGDGLSPNTAITPRTESAYADFVADAADLGKTITIKAASSAEPEIYGILAIDVVGAGNKILDSVEVIPEGNYTNTVERGSFGVYEAKVKGSNLTSLDEVVAWSIVESGRHDGTSISARGVLTVSADEPLDRLTIKATATVGEQSEFGVLVIDIKNPPKPVVTGVKVSPKEAKVPVNKGITFGVVVEGRMGEEALPQLNQTVTWSISEFDGKSDPAPEDLKGIAISATGGALTIPKDDAFVGKILIVRATALTEDAQGQYLFDEARVTVDAPIGSIVASLTVNPDYLEIHRGSALSSTIAAIAWDPEGDMPSGGDNPTGYMYSWSFHDGEGSFGSPEAPATINGNTGLVTIPPGFDWERYGTFRVRAKANMDSKEQWFESAEIKILEPVIATAEIVLAPGYPETINKDLVTPHKPHVETRFTLRVAGQGHPEIGFDHSRVEWNVEPATGASLHSETRIDGYP